MSTQFEITAINDSDRISHYPRSGDLVCTDPAALLDFLKTRYPKATSAVITLVVANKDDPQANAQRDRERLDWLEHKVKFSAGISFDWVSAIDKDYPSGWRYRHQNYTSSPKQSLRDAIDVAMSEHP